MAQCWCLLDPCRPFCVPGRMPSLWTERFRVVRPSAQSISPGARQQGGLCTHSVYVQWEFISANYCCQCGLLKLVLCMGFPVFHLGGKSSHLTFLKNKRDFLASSKHCSLERWSILTISWSMPLGIPPNNTQEQPGSSLRIVIVGILVAIFWFESRNCVRGENVFIVCWIFQLWGKIITCNFFYVW